MRGALIFFGICAALSAQSRPGMSDLPAGFIVSADRATLLPAVNHVERTAAPGDILFPGDTVNAADGSVTLDYCPAGSPQKVEVTATARVQIPRQGQIAANINGVRAVSLDMCDLPPFEREPELATVRSIKDLALETVSPAALVSQIQALPAAAQGGLLALALGDLTMPRIRLAFAAELERQGLWDAAIDQYVKLAAVWSDQSRVYKRIEQLRSKPSARSTIQPPATTVQPPAQAPPKGRTFALVIGISKYDQKSLQNLAYADRDAADFAAYLRTPRGGLGEKDQLNILLNEEATSAEIRQRMNLLKSSAGKNDAVIVFAAGHGDMANGAPRLITHYADRQYVGITAYPMKEFQQVLDGQAAPWGRAMIFLDICQSGYLAQFAVATPHLVPNYLMMMGANPITGDGGKVVANAYEDAVFGGGHGAFTYYLLRGLNTREAKIAGGEFVTAPELKLYVESKVTQATLLKQTPATVFNMGQDMGIADLRLPGQNTAYTNLDVQLKLAEARLRSVKRGAQNGSSPGLDSTAIPPESPTERDLQTLIDLENQGDEILLRYLRGEEEPLTRADFDRCETLFRQALVLEPGSPYLEARAEFCEGRKLEFGGNYAQSIEHLERSIRLDPGGAYAFNALGIAYLEQAQYAEASAAFLDAIDRAPLWAYPLHNLALTRTQTGDYDQAIAAYRKAMSLAPQYSYLPYNLGLVYQKINRVDEARDAYEKAAGLTQTKAAADIALGLLFANTGHETDALTHYDGALERLRQYPDPLNLAIVTHNKAALLARHRNSRDEAIALWRENIMRANYVPSRIGLAALLSGIAAQRRPGWQDAANEAVSQYEAILTADKDYLSARLESAALLQDLGRAPEALAAMTEAARRFPTEAAVFERLGDLQAANRLPGDARVSWQKANGLTRSPELRARVRKKLRNNPPA